MIEIYTDGSCEPNPGFGSYGFVKLLNGKMIDCKVFTEENTTNNRMEYKAIIEAIKSCGFTDKVTIYTDSKLALNTINTWMYSWERRGWKREKGEIKNLDLVQDFYLLRLDYRFLTVKWVKAHNGNRWNEFIDQALKLRNFSINNKLL